MSSDAFPGRVMRGEVYEITPAGDPEQRAFRVRIRPRNIGDLPVGLTLEVNILTSRKGRALLVPGGAVREGAAWVVDKGRARKVSGASGIRGEESVEIIRGLDGGTCVIKNPPKDLHDGIRVSAKGC